MAEPSDFYRQYSAASWLHIASASDLATVRSTLLTYLWGGSLPSRMPDTIVTNTSGFTTTTQVSGWGTNLASTDKWTVNTEGGHSSKVYVYRPTTVPATVGNRIAICHHGHEDVGYGVENCVKECIAAGLTTLEIFMPGYGGNNTTHDCATGAELATRFLEPTVVALNQVLSERSDWQGVGMIGVSGGGWTTTLIAAADTRIRWSYPAAGSCPQALSENGGPDDTARDVEQLDIADAGALYGDQFNNASAGKVTYCDLYVLGACGANRKQVQCSNPGDPFFGNYIWMIYEGIVKRRAALCGGDFSINVLNPSQGSHNLWPQWRTAFVNDMTVPVVRGNRRVFKRG